MALTQSRLGYVQSRADLYNATPAFLHAKDERYLLYWIVHNGDQ